MRFATNIENQVITGLIKVESEISKISEYTDLNLNLIVISYSDLKASTVMDVLTNLEVGEDDVIFFMWNGHGFNIDFKQIEKFKNKKSYLAILSNNQVCIPRSFRSSS